ncbi:DUF1028 domain-containing protein [Paracoccus sp. TK19116]|uniref:DUF1028 domain-containing protein n=1 Tax=Paracoccus albicereus TaxID=2922394 RepID=A0ABT1MS32_9RHOB|nr:DUF1028 domain-containing protein [Paracoccus albicereus]MCQ0971120.1 DUF1028 domain-containing protein [Paracoccus albicereus]
MTYSLIAKDPDTGAVGIAVASRFFACGSLVPHVGATAAFATQAFVNPLWGVEGLARLQSGESAQDVLDDLVARDRGQRQRQGHAIDAQGRFAAHTGADCVDWAGHLLGDGFSVAGNMLEGPEVVEETARVYAERDDLAFPDRMLAAMQAGEDAGGDKRGRQAAGLLIHRGQTYPWLDLRVDDDADPLSELRRLLSVAHERYMFVTEIMPTAENFSGTPDRSDIDRRIAEADAARTASASRASNK